MKKKCITLFLFFISISTSAQLDLRHNGIRIGDQILKQQIDKVDIGGNGKDIIWDFQNISLINDQYELIYTKPEQIGDSLFYLGKKQISSKEISTENDVIVGIEHQTKYYYLQTPDSIILLGHENIAGKAEYIDPMLIQKFPATYGIATKKNYSINGLYSNIESFQTKGSVEQIIDSKGMMIIPEGDTLTSVIRQKTTQIILNISESQSYDERLAQELITYRWYTKGYRYPIFESIECKEVVTDIVLFSTAFYYPLQEHYYLESDPENMSILDELWKESESLPIDNSPDLSKKQTISNLKIYPNPVESDLHIEYDLSTESPVIIAITSMSGIVYKTITENNQKAGTNTNVILCSDLPSGIYILKVITNDTIVTEKIIKK